MPGDSGEKKIIIDEDWKTQVEREKQEAAKTRDTTEQTSRASGFEGPMPPASLSVLVTMLATQALMSLGQIPNPVTGKAELQAEQAKHMIDLLQVVQEKTAGNRTPDETQMLDDVLHELRMAYISIGGPVTK